MQDTKHKVKALDKGNCGVAKVRTDQDCGGVVALSPMFVLRTLALGAWERRVFVGLDFS
jgi:hypothetical protein